MRKTEDISFDYSKPQKTVDTKIEKALNKKEKKSLNAKVKKAHDTNTKKTYDVSVKNDSDTKVKKGVWHVIYEWLDSFVFAILLILLVFTFFVRIVGVSGDSMNPTLNNGDWLTVKAINTTINRGDIVVVTQPNDRNEPLIKRVIAVGGDTLNINFTTGAVKVNGEIIDEPYILEPTVRQGDFKTPIEIPEGYLFVMGDNRNDSLDSRFNEIGIIDERYVLGVANARLYPFGEWEIY